jgi:hypothetical protein
MVKYDIRCSPGHMRKCKAIARNKFMVNRSNWNALPPSVAKLYPLSGIRPERLQILKEGGELHSKMKISDAVELAESEKGVYRPRPKQRTPAQRSRTAADLAEDDADNMESDTGSGSGSGDGAEDDSDREPDPERLAIDGEDLIEQFKIARAGGRRMVEYMRQHGDEVARGMLANGLRELANALNRDADQLDPPAPAPRARQRPKSKAKSKKKKRARS